MIWFAMCKSFPSQHFIHKNSLELNLHMQKGSEFDEKAASTWVGRDVTGEKKGKKLWAEETGNL